MIKNANEQVETYIHRLKIWQDETIALREILLSCKLTETIKWGKPCYMSGNINIAIIQGFKSYFALLFFKGYLLTDPKKILVKTGANTRVGRQIRFADVDEIIKLKPVLKSYILEAVATEKAGVKNPVSHPVAPGNNFELPEELINKLNKSATLNNAFNKLTPGRQRGYIIYFSAAKQTHTRQSRIEKCIPKILQGKGINDL